MFAGKEAVVGDLHGFAKELNKLVAKPVEEVFFVGDMTGSVELNKLKTLFNQVHDSVNKAEKLNALSRLKKLESDLLGEKMKPMGEREKDSEMSKLLEYKRHSLYMGGLPQDVKDNLVIGVKQELDKLIEWNIKVSSLGTRVYMITGNWDEYLPFDFEVKKRSVDIVKYLRGGGVNIYDNYGIIEEEKKIVLMAPYGVVNDGLVNQNILNKINLEKSRGSRVMMITHVPPNMRIHEENNHRKTSSEMEEQSAAANKVLFQVKPDELVYGHVHTRLENDNFVSYRDTEINMVYCAYREIKLRV